MKKKVRLETSPVINKCIECGEELPEEWDGYCYDCCEKKRQIVFPERVKKALEDYAFCVYKRQGFSKLNGGWFEVIPQEIIEEEEDKFCFIATIKYGLDEIGHKEYFYFDVVYRDGNIEEYD